MSEGFEHEPFHVPQQSRREKLRETPTSLQVGCAGLLPFQDHSLLSSTMLTCAPTDNHHLPHKEYSTNFMGFVGLGTGFLPSSSSSSSSSSQLLFDLPHSSISLNHSLNQEDIHSANNPFLYPSQIPQNMGDFDPSFVHDGGVSFKQQTLTYSPQDMVSTGQGLSLSLSSHYRNRSDAACTGIFDEKGVGRYVVGGVSGGAPMTRSSVPTGPFTGYAAILKGSRFLKPAHQLLEEFCSVGRGFYTDRSGGESPGSPSGREMETLSESAVVDDGPVGSSSRGERQRMKARLISLLNEVYRRYKQYYQQLQAVITSFETVAGLSTAAPYISFAIKAMSKHFQCLKNAITDQLRFTSKVSEESLSKEENQYFGLVDQGIRQHKVSHNLSILEQQHVWRPQRGLPEQAVAVLRAWLFEHFLHPYPTDADKQMLAKQTGLSRSQVSNWFINARVRLWKPMVEEIHSLEMRQAQKVSEGESNATNGQCKLPGTPVPPMDKQPQNTTNQKNQDLPLKRNRNELAQVPNDCDELVNNSYGNVSSHHGGRVGVSQAGGNSGISLTLGLQQNNGSGMSEPLPLAVPHFGLEEDNNSYVMGGFESQNRRDFSGQLSHDFVG